MVFSLSLMYKKDSEITPIKGEENFKIVLLFNSN